MNRSRSFQNWKYAMMEICISQLKGDIDKIEMVTLNASIYFKIT